MVNWAVPFRMWRSKAVVEQELLSGLNRSQSEKCDSRQREPCRNLMRNTISIQKPYTAEQMVRSELAQIV